MPFFFVDNAWELTPEELIVARARVRWHWFAAGAGLALSVVGAFTARPAVHAVKSWQSRRLAAQALAYIELQRWPQARDRTVDAYALEPAEPMALRAYGRLLARTRNAGALPFYRRLQNLEALTTEDRRDFAEIALSVGEISEAATQSAWLLAHDRVAAQPAGQAHVPPVDWLLAAQAASASGDERAALAFARQLLTDPAASESEQFTAAVRLVNAAAATDPNGPATTPAWECLRKLAESRGPVGLDALMLLSRRPASAPGQGEPPGWINPADIAHRLETHPLARVPQKLLASDLAADAKPGSRARVLDAAVARWRDSDEVNLAALADWLLHKGEAARALEVLPAARAVRSVELSLRRFDTLAALGRWAEIKTALGSDNPLDPLSQHMYQAATEEHLDHRRDAVSEWNQALEFCGHDPGKFFALGQYAESQGASETAESAYAAAAAAAPRMRPAHDALFRLADAHGQTAQARRVLAATLEIWPRDENAVNLEAYLRLLLGASAADALTIEKNAASLAAHEPGNWQARATLALARLRQGQGASALQAFTGLRAAGGGPVPPGALAVRAAALAAAGWKDEARADAHALAGTILRPEERVLIAPLVVD